MAAFNTSFNIPVLPGTDEYTNTGLHGIGKQWTPQTASNPISFQPDDFASAIYRDSGYSPLHPCNTTPDVAMNLDCLA